MWWWQVLDVRIANNSSPTPNIIISVSFWNVTYILAFDIFGFGFFLSLYLKSWKFSWTNSSKKWVYDWPDSSWRTVIKSFDAFGTFDLCFDRIILKSSCSFNSMQNICIEINASEITKRPKSFYDLNSANSYLFTWEWSSV